MFSLHCLAQGLLQQLTGNFSRENKATVIVDPEFQPRCEEIRKSQGHLAMLQFLFQEMCHNRYIQEERLLLNIIFPPKQCQRYQARLQCSINCSKPEIKATDKKIARNLAPNAQCVICKENVGFKPGLRGWSLNIGGRDFFLQPPPYPYCENHFVLIESEHTPQAITPNTLVDIRDAGLLLPGVYICSNTDRSGTGASILEHKHYQIASKRFPVFDAPSTLSASTGRVNVEFLDFPAASIKLTFPTSAMDEGISVAERLLSAWRSTEIADSLDVDHNGLTMSFIFFYDDFANVELLLIPRSMGNMTRKFLHCIKAEFVGILEMAGFAILPGRLKSQLTSLLLEEKSINTDDEQLKQFSEWMETLNIQVDKDQSPDLVASKTVQDALNMSFELIIEDNSGFSAKDTDTAKKWASLAGITLK